MKYIDADLLRKKIAEQMKSLPREVGRGAGTITSKGSGMMEAFQIVRSIIDSLQQEQPEVDSENSGWIDCGKQMPKETKQWSDTLQGHREWTESDLVLAWDSVYGCRVDATKNGKWMSEQRGGYTGQIVHGIIAWRPIPEFNEELLFNARKEQPVEGLEEEYKDYVENDPVYSKLVNRNAGLGIARHFYELGINARKER